MKRAQKSIETLSSKDVKKLYENNEITLVDVRDIRELWKEGTIENSKHIPRGMLNFGLILKALIIKLIKLKKLKNWFYSVRLAGDLL